MSLVRQPSVANQFYPANVLELEAQIDQYLSVDATTAIPKAIIVPHAGYIYSGGIAGQVFSNIIKVADQIKRVVLFGPAHRWGFRGVASSDVDYFLTPLGSIPVDKALQQFAVEEAGVLLEERAFDGEHCLEVQLPFLQKTLNDFKILPLIIGDCESDKVVSLMEALWGEEDTLIVISSDLSHFLDYDHCVAKDRRTADAINEKKYQTLDYHDACGRTGVKAVLKIAQEKQLTVEEVAICNSGDTAGNKERVVGYGGWLIY